MAQVEKGLLLLLLLLKYHIKEKFNLLNALFFVFHFFQGAIFQNYQGYSKLSRKFYFYYYYYLVMLSIAWQFDWQATLNFGLNGQALESVFFWQNMDGWFLKYFKVSRRWLRQFINSSNYQIISGYQDYQNYYYL